MTYLCFRPKAFHLWHRRKEAARHKKQDATNTHNFRKIGGYKKNLWFLMTTDDGSWLRWSLCSALTFRTSERVRRVAYSPGKCVKDAAHTKSRRAVCCCSSCLLAAAAHSADKRMKNWGILFTAGSISSRRKQKYCRLC